MNATHSQRERFVAELVRRAPAAQHWHAQRLMRYAGTFGRLSEKAERSLQDEKKLDGVRERIQGIVFDIRCQVTFVKAQVIMMVPDKKLLEVPRVTNAQPERTIQP